MPSHRLTEAEYELVQDALRHLRDFYREFAKARKLNPRLKLKLHLLEHFMAFTFADDWTKLKAAVELSKTQAATITAQNGQIADLQSQLAAAQAQIPPQPVLDALADAHTEAGTLPDPPPAAPPAQ